MEHVPYPKIASRRDAAISSSPAGPWVATEKVHGAQLVVATDGRALRFGKRKAWLAPDEPFFGWQLLRAELAEAARCVRRLAGARGVVWLYGELFGGSYPHPDVAPVAGMSAVQTGVWYAPDIRFALFDILVQDVLLADSEIRTLAGPAGLFVVPRAARGSRQEMERVSERGETRVPSCLGLPRIAGNVGEGLVLRPDARVQPSALEAVKVKIVELDELHGFASPRASAAPLGAAPWSDKMAKARFDGSAPWPSDAPLDLDAFEKLASRLVGPARIASARSKVGTEPELVRDEVVLDVLADLAVVYPVAFAALGSAAEEALAARVEAAAALVAQDAGLRSGRRRR